jgi:hypothetical protein
MIDHDFQTMDRQRSDLPNFLKKSQIKHGLEMDQAFNEVIHVDLIEADPMATDAPASTILSITDHTRTFTRLAVLADDKINSVATTLWHHWCQPYGNPVTIRASKGWTSKLESRMNNLGQRGPKIICRSEKETFFPEIRQQWEQHRLDTSAQKFAQDWNFFCHFQAPSDANSRTNDLNQVDSNLDDIKDFVEANTNCDGYTLEEPEPGRSIQRKQVRLCRHKLQARSYPKKTKKKAWPSPEYNLDPANPDLDHEWIQLLQMETELKRRRSQLREVGARNQANPDMDNLPIDKENLACTKDIFNSSPNPNCHRQSSNQLKLKSSATEDVSTCARTLQTPPPKFNKNFNQNSTTRSSNESHLSYFSTTDDKGDSELGDYFSDDEEEDIEIEELGDYFSDNEEADAEFYQNSKGEDSFWSQTTVPNSTEKLPLPQTAFSDWNPVISSLDIFKEAEEEEQIGHIAGFLEANQLGFSTWQPFIPLGHVFQNSAAHSQQSDFSPRASSSQEPTRITISTISTSTRLTKNKTIPHRETSLSPSKRWRSSRPPTRRSTTTWTEPWTELREVCEESQNWQKEWLEHPETSNTVKHWTRQDLYSNEPNQNQNINCQNTPQATDAGNEPQLSIWWKSRSYSTTTSRLNTTRTRCWGTKWRRFSNKTRIYLTRLQKNTRPPQRNLKRTQLWPWSQKQFPPTCSLNTVRTVKRKHKQITCLPGENHFLASQIKLPNTGTNPECPDLLDSTTQPKKNQLLSGSYATWLRQCSQFTQSARWEMRSTFSPTQTRRINKPKHKKTRATKNTFPKRGSESEGYNQQSESYDPYKIRNSRNDSKSESKDMTVKTAEQLKTLLETAKVKVTAKADEVRTVEKTLKEFRAEKGKQVDKKIETEVPVTLPPHFATTINISILTLTIFIFIYNVFISIFEPFVSDHHSQTFTIGDPSDCKRLNLSQQTNSAQAKTTVKALAKPDSIRLFKVPETQPDPSARNFPRKPLVSKHPPSGQVRKSENDLYNDSFSYSTT